jgi:hypothetical protein
MDDPEKPSSSLMLVSRGENVDFRDPELAEEDESTDSGDQRRCGSGKCGSSGFLSWDEPTDG